MWWESMKFFRPPLPKQQNLRFYSLDEKNVNNTRTGKDVCRLCVRRSATSHLATVSAVLLQWEQQYQLQSGEKREIIIRCQRKIISLSMILYTQRKKKCTQKEEKKERNWGRMKSKLKKKNGQNLQANLHFGCFPMRTILIVLRRCKEAGSGDTDWEEKSVMETGWPTSSSGTF